MHYTILDIQSRLRTAGLPDSRWTVKRLIDNKELEAKKENGAWIIDKTDIDRFIDEKRKINPKVGKYIGIYSRLSNGTFEERVKALKSITRKAKKWCKENDVPFIYPANLKGEGNIRVYSDLGGVNEKGKLSSYKEMKRDLFDKILSHLFVNTTDRITRGNHEYFLADCKMNGCKLVVFDQLGKSAWDLVGEDKRRELIDRVYAETGSRRSAAMKAKEQEFKPLVELAKKRVKAYSKDPKMARLRGIVEGWLALYRGKDRSVALLANLRSVSELQ